FVRDRQAGVTERVSVDSAGNQANDLSHRAAISPDGRYVVFISSATNLVPGLNNGLKHVFLRDRQTGLTERVSVDSAGNQANDHSLNAGISADGRFVVFTSVASSLVPGDTDGFNDVYVRDRQTGVTERTFMFRDARRAAPQRFNRWNSG